MKKLLTLTAVGAILATPAMAVQKCVALDANGDYANPSSVSYNDHRPDWSVIFSNLVIKGIAFCGSTTGADIGSVSDIVTGYFGYEPEYVAYDNKECWCKMTNPAVSSNWVFAYSFPNTGECWYDCAGKCVSYLQGDATFRSALFSTISN